MIDERENEMKKIILASASPRRKELLEQIGASFHVVVSDVDEQYESIIPAEVVKEIALLKAKAVADGIGYDALVIGADTIVVFEGKILGKPKDELDAINMIKSLQGCEHKVFTGVALIDTKNQGQKLREVFVEETKVCVRSMCEEEIIEYIQKEKPFDKAGAYGIQGSFAKFVTRIEGDYYNVVGLPLAALYDRIKNDIKEME